MHGAFADVLYYPYHRPVRHEVGVRIEEPVCLNRQEKKSGSKGQAAGCDNEKQKELLRLVNKYEISDKFRVDYKYCYATDKCIDSYEYLTPTATGNYYKVLMKVDGSFSIDENLNSTEITNFNTFLNTFSTLNYKIGDVWKSQKLYTQNIKPKVGGDSGMYIEVPYEIKNATEINLTFNIRNLTYKYILK